MSFIINLIICIVAAFIITLIIGFICKALKIQRFGLPIALIFVLAFTDIYFTGDFSFCAIIAALISSAVVIAIVYLIDAKVFKGKLLN